MYHAGYDMYQPRPRMPTVMSQQLPNRFSAYRGPSSSLVNSGYGHGYQTYLHPQSSNTSIPMAHQLQGYEYEHSLEYYKPYNQLQHDNEYDEFNNCFPLNQNNKERIYGNQSQRSVVPQPALHQQQLQQIRPSHGIGHGQVIQQQLKNTVVPPVRHQATAFHKRNLVSAQPIASNGQKNSNIKNNSSSTFKPRSRTVNPPMPMLPKPQPLSNHNNGKRQQPKQQPQQQKEQMMEISPVKKFEKTSTVKGTVNNKKESPTPQQSLLIGVRMLSGCIPQLLKWKVAKHKVAPLYETIGIVCKNDEANNGRLHPMESGFYLRNRPEWSFSLNDPVLDCVTYNMDRSSVIFPLGTSVRIVGRFMLNDRFQCLKVRLMNDHDFSWLAKKLKHYPGVPALLDNGGNNDESFSISTVSITNHPTVPDNDNNNIDESFNTSSMSINNTENMLQRTMDDGNMIGDEETLDIHAAGTMLFGSYLY